MKSSTAKPMPRTARARARGSRPLSILVPIDFADPSREALQFAADFARRYGGRIAVLSVIQPDPLTRLQKHPLLATQKTMRERVTFKVTDLARRHIGEELLDEVLVQSGAPFEMIVATARARKADFIIMATHGYTGLKHMLLGSTTERVIKLAPCPVVTVHGDDSR